MPENSDQATIFNVDLERTYGVFNPVKMAMPVILPALIKLNWQDYFAGAAMAAAMTGKTIGEQIRNGQVPEQFKSFGTTIEEIFCDLPELRALYGTQADTFSTGAIGVLSFLFFFLFFLIPFFFQGFFRLFFNGFLGITWFAHDGSSCVDDIL